MRAGDLPEFPIVPIAAVALRSEVSRAGILGTLSAAVGLDSAFTKGLKEIQYLRLRMYQRAVAAILADEFQWGSRSKNANAFVAQLLTLLSDIGPPVVYACNYSLGHKLKKRPPEDRARFLAKPLVMLPLLPTDSAFGGFLRDAKTVLGGALDVDTKSDVEEIHAMTYGLRRMMVRLLTAGYRAARDAQRQGGDKFCVTMEHIRTGYKSNHYGDDRLAVASSFAAQLGVTDDLDFVCPFEVPADQQSTIRKLAQQRQQFALNEAMDAKVRTRGEREIDKSSSKLSKSGAEPVPARSAKGRRLAAPKTAADLLSGL